MTDNVVPWKGTFTATLEGAEPQGLGRWQDGLLDVLEDAHVGRERRVPAASFMSKISADPLTGGCLPDVLTAQVPPLPTGRWAGDTVQGRFRTPRLPPIQCPVLSAEGSHQLLAPGSALLLA